MNLPETKDRSRIRDIYDSPSDRRISLATKMAKLITDSEKIERRWRAAIEQFGSAHPVTQIFNQRVSELNRNYIPTVVGTIPPPKAITTTSINENKIKKEPKQPTKLEPAEIVLNRSQKDFPIGCSVKNKNTDRKGTVVAHDIEPNIITVQFEDETVEVNIYLLKRA